MAISIPDTLTADNSGKYIMSIRLRSDGLSFSGYCPSESESFFYRNMEFDRTKPYISSLKEFFFGHEFLTYSYKRTNLVYVTSQYTVVPEEVFTEKQKNDDLNARKQSLSYINSVFEENEGIKNVYSPVNSLYNATETQNENLNSLIKQLEANLPRTMTVSFLQSNDDGINMTITSETDISIARMLMNLESMEMVDKDGQKIPVLTNISIPSVTAADGDDGSTVYNFSVSAQYYQVVQALAQEAENASAQSAQASASPAN